MKKYLLGIFAVILAIGAMSFEASKKVSTVEYYWYDAQTGDLIDNTKSETPPTGCSVDDGPLCAYGHTRMLEENEDPSEGNPLIVTFD